MTGTPSEDGPGPGARPAAAAAEPSLGTRAARGTAVTLVSQVGRVAIMFAATIILARLVSPFDYGLLAMVLAVTALAEVFRDFGLSMAALQAKHLTQYQKSNLFWINSAVGLALTGIIFGLSWPIAAFYGQPSLVIVVQLISTMYVVGALGAQFRVAINRQLRFVALALCDLLPPLVAFGAALVVAMGGYGLEALVTQQLVTAGVTLLVTVALARWWPSLPRRGQDMRALLSFGVSFAATQLLTYLTRNVDSIAIGRVWGAGPLGLYDRAFQLSVAPINQINVPMSRVAVPVLSRIRDDRARFARSLQTAQLMACYVTSSGLLVVAGIGTPLTILLLGSEWALAGTILSLLAVGGVFRAIQQIAFWMFMSQGLAASQLRLYLVGQPVIVASMLAGLPWGPVGVATGSIIGYAAFWVLSLWWAGRASKLSVRPLMIDALRATLVFGAPAGAAAFLVASLVPLPPLALVPLGVAAALAWMALMAVVSRRIREDLKTLFRFARVALGGRS